MSWFKRCICAKSDLIGNWPSEDCPRHGWTKPVSPPAPASRPRGLPPKPVPGVGDVARPVIHIEVHVR